MKARIKQEIFKKADIVMVIFKYKASAYGGFKHNPWLPCRNHMSKVQVFLNGNWKDIDTHDWEVTI